MTLSVLFGDRCPSRVRMAAISSSCILAEKQIKRGADTSVKEMIAAIEAFIRRQNEIQSRSDGPSRPPRWIGASESGHQLVLLGRDKPQAMRLDGQRTAVRRGLPGKRFPHGQLVYENELAYARRILGS
jgi:hypothetical protein